MSARRSAADSASRLEVRLHADIRAVEPIWRKIEAEGHLTAFQRYDWLLPLCMTALPRSGARLVVVEVLDRVSGATLMLMPLVSVRGLLHTRLQHLDLGVCDYAAPLLASTLELDRHQAFEAWRLIEQVLPRHDLMRISRFPALIGGLPNPLFAVPGCVRAATQSFDVALGDGPDLARGRLSQGAAAREFRRRQRKLAEEGPVRLVVASDPGEVDAMFDTLLRQRRERFSAIGRSNLLDEPAFAAFYREAAHRGLAAGPARLLGLRVGDVWVAMVYGLVHDGAFHMVIPTMEEGRWRTYAPGLQLIVAAMAWSREQGCRRFDFTIGHMPYKTELGAEPDDLFEIDLAVTWKGRLVQRLELAESRLRAWLNTRSPRLFDVLRDAKRRLNRLRERRSSASPDAALPRPSG